MDATPMDALLASPLPQKRLCPKHSLMRFCHCPAGHELGCPTNAHHAAAEDQAPSRTSNPPPAPGLWISLCHR
eukprot:363794-Chlamydomonas_euryale.AAC.10